MIKYLFAFAMVYLAAQEPSALEHNNKVVYGGIRTGVVFDTAFKSFPGFGEKLSGNFVELEARAETDNSLKIKRPPGMDVYDRFAVKMPIKVYESPEVNQCDSPSQMVFLAFPPNEEGKTTYRLYSYDYLVCAGGGEISPSRLFDKYMEKYGSYDKKDYDRNMYIYDNVRKKFRVGVIPTKTESTAGLSVHIVEDLVFSRAYEKWRLYVRILEEGSKTKF